MTLSDQQRLHVRVYGLVQGVGFRYYVLNIASGLGLVGWTRNRRDDSVEVIAEGEIEVLKSLVKALERGSNSSVVEEVKTNLQEASGEFGSFYIRPTI
jgi:acylphosphatase